MSGQRLLVVGDGPVAERLAPMAGMLGWEAMVAATLPEALAGVRTADAVVVTSHHAEVDGPAIAAAVAAGPAYVGAMGSRRTQARRRDWLLANGVSAAALDDVHGPAGVDLGAGPPREIALGLPGRLVATRRGATGVGYVAGRSGPIHPALP